MMEDKIALVEIGDTNIADARQAHIFLESLGEKDDWYIYNTKEYDLAQEVEDLKQFYAGIFIVNQEESK